MTQPPRTSLDPWTPPFDPAEPIPGWTVDRHLDAFVGGYFPMAEPIREARRARRRHRRILWHCPAWRSFLPLREDQGLHVPRTIAKILRRGDFEFRTDTRFGDVIRSCAIPRRDDDFADGTWIDERIIAMYERLHDAGCAHSFEAWRRDPETGAEALVGGVYGLSIGRVFFAESMYHVPRPRRADGSKDPLDGSNASSAALIALCRHLDACGYTLADVQLGNEHTYRFGVWDEDMYTAVPRIAEAAGHGRCWRGLSDEATEARSDGVTKRRRD